MSHELGHRGKKKEDHHEVVGDGWMQELQERWVQSWVRKTP